ncbi:MAG: hypothetical protein MRJ65_03650 [Candidatus Brocadiaceae bacterium]|nr:hypothetical protein [Candidatus Brocadiaceae bacterium]
MIAIFFALSQEIAPLKARVNILKKIRHAHATFYQSEFSGFPVALIQTGIGKNVSEIIPYVTKRFRIQLFVSSGFAGSLKPEVGIGDLIIGKQVLTTQQKISEEKIQINAALPCDTPTVNAAVKASSFHDFNSHCGDILSVNTIIQQASLKKHLGIQTPAIAVDMESFMIAEQSNAMGIPFVVVRAISDGVAEDLKIEEKLVTKSGNISISATALHVLQKPYHIPYLNRLRKQTKLAAHTLEVFLPDFITQIHNSVLT